jgi:rubrerythrin
MVDLSRPSNAFGKRIGGAGKHCSKCQIYFCFVCSFELISIQKKYPVECPACGKELTFLE